MRTDKNCLKIQSCNIKILLLLKVVLSFSFHMRFFKRYLKGRVTGRKGKTGWEKSSNHCLTHQMTSVSWTRSKARLLEFHPGIPHGGRSSRTWSFFCYFPRCITRGLDCKLINPDSNWYHKGYQYCQKQLNPPCHYASPSHSFNKIW